MPSEAVAASEAVETETAASEAEETAPESEQGGESTPPDKSASSEEDESGQASEAANQEESEFRTNSESRIRQLTRQVKDLERKLSGGAQPQTLSEPKEPPEPSLATFDTIEAYDEAMKGYKAGMRKYAADLSDFKSQQAVKKSDLEKSNRELKSSWDKKSAMTEKRHSDFDGEKAFESVQPTPAMDGFILDSDIGPDLLWELQNNPDEADRIRELPPYRAVRELHKLEDKLLNQIKGIKKPLPGKPTPFVPGTGAAPKKPRTAAEVLYS